MPASNKFREIESANRRYLNWVRKKHARDGFADEIVAALEAEFKLHPPTSNDQRAPLYERVRSRVTSVSSFAQQR